jgi:hypothetical protein
MAASILEEQFDQKHIEVNFINVKFLMDRLGL